MSVNCEFLIRLINIVTGNYASKLQSVALVYSFPEKNLQWSFQCNKELQINFALFWIADSLLKYISARVPLYIYYELLISVIFISPTFPDYNSACDHGICFQVKVKRSSHFNQSVNQNQLDHPTNYVKTIDITNSQDILHTYKVFIFCNVLQTIKESRKHGSVFEIQLPNAEQLQM